MKKFLVVIAAGIALFLLTAYTVPFVMEPEPIGPPIAPEPSEYPDAVVQVYGADVWGVRGRFAIHTWIATKEVGARTYTIYQVVSWGLRRSGTAVSISEGMPNRPWFRSPPLLLHEVKGEDARSLVARVEAAVDAYPYAQEYTMWPGPNSNSFIEWIGLEVPELGLTLPAKAIGKNWMQETYPDLKNAP